MGPKARRRAAARAALAAPRSLLLLLVGFFVGKAAAVDLTSVALAGLASIPELPEVDMNAMARGITKTDTFQGIKRGVNDLGLGEMAQDLDLSEIVKGLPPGLRLRTPGLCAYYDDAAAVCHYTTTNGIRARVAGPCSGKLDGVVPTCRGHPDAYTVPLPKSQVDIGVTGHVTPTAPTRANPAPAPTTKPSIIKRPRPSRNPTIQAGGGPDPKDAAKNEEGTGGPYDDDEPMKKEKEQAFTGFAALGLSVGAAVVCAIVSTLGVALYAHRLRQRGQLPQAEARPQAHALLLHAKAAKGFGIARFVPPQLPLEPVPEGVGEAGSELGPTPRSCGI